MKTLTIKEMGSWLVVVDAKSNEFYEKFPRNNKLPLSQDVSNWTETALRIAQRHCAKLAR